MLWCCLIVRRWLKLYLPAITLLACRKKTCKYLPQPKYATALIKSGWTPPGENSCRKWFHIKKKKGNFFLNKKRWGTRRIVGWQQGGDLQSQSHCDLKHWGIWWIVWLISFIQGLFWLETKRANFKDKYSLTPRCEGKGDTHFMTPALCRHGTSGEKHLLAPTQRC